MVWNIRFRSPLIFEKTKDGTFWYTEGVSKYTQDTRTIQGQINAYNFCAPLSGIIQRKAKALNNGKVYFLDNDGKAVTNAYVKKMQALMSRPNPLQSWNQFQAQLYTYLEIFGECFVFALIPSGFDKLSVVDMSRTKALWVIPNWIMTVTESGKVFMQSDAGEIITKYEILNNGTPIELPIKQVLHLKDTTLNTDFILRGQSRLYSLQDPVSNIVAAYEARNVLIVRKGALGILSNNSKDMAGQIPLKPEEKEKLQQEFRNYGLGKDQYQVIITNANLQWQSMTFPTKELMLFEEIEDDVRQICDNYDYPFPLLGFKGESALNNGGAQREAKATLYQDAIIPDAEAIYAEFSRFFDTEKYGFNLKIFYDHLEVLQKSEKDKAEALKLRVQAFDIGWKGKAITLEEYRKLAYDLDEARPNGTLYDGKPDNTITVN